MPNAIKWMDSSLPNHHNWLHAFPSVHRGRAKVAHTNGMTNTIWYRRIVWQISLVLAFPIRRMVSVLGMFPNRDFLMHRCLKYQKNAQHNFTIYDNYTVDLQIPPWWKSKFRFGSTPMQNGFVACGLRVFLHIRFWNYSKKNFNFIHSSFLHGIICRKNSLWCAYKRIRRHWQQERSPSQNWWQALWSPHHWMWLIHSECKWLLRL